MLVYEIRRIGRKDTEKAGGRCLFSDFGFKRQNGAGEGENKHKENPGVQRVQVFTLKSKAVKTEYLISSGIVLGCFLMTEPSSENLYNTRT